MSTPEPHWGLIADVHGNLLALEAALRVLSEAGARQLAFLGDYLGRGDSDRCVQRIREVATVAVVGNRDYDWQDRVAPASRAWVHSLPRVALTSAGRLLLSHGDARLTPALGTNQITRDFVRAWRQMEQTSARVWAFGHSHQARLWRKASASVAAEWVDSRTAVLAPTHRYFLNVGTTGLPFPGKGGPSVALVDFERSLIRHIPLGPIEPE